MAIIKKIQKKATTSGKKRASSKQVSETTRAKKFAEDFYSQHGKLMSKLAYA
jgi:hypothetical protein